MDRRDFVNKGALAALAAGAGSIFSRASAGEGETSASRRNVKSFGAQGDGKTDDSAAIEKALASDAGTLVFERGVYKLSRTIVVDLSKRGWTSIDGTGGARAAHSRRRRLQRRAALDDRLLHVRVRLVRA